MHPSSLPSCKPIGASIVLYLFFSNSPNPSQKLTAKPNLQRGLLDFADLEQHAIDLLWDRSEEEPTDLARDIQRRYHSVYVDEYQDINGAQDCILSAISKDPFQGNRFLVGDIKQSIYAFRLASPCFFKAYQHRWEQTQLEGPHHVIYLKDNFRSHPGILDFVNAIFRHLMYAGISESDYLKKVALNSGAFQPKPTASDSETASETVVHCRFICDEEHSEIPTMEKEAMVIADHFRRLHTDGTLVRDPKTSEWRPVAWHDMAIFGSVDKKVGRIFSQGLSQSRHSLGRRRKRTDRRGRLQGPTPLSRCCITSSGYSSGCHSAVAFSFIWTIKLWPGSASITARKFLGGHESPLQGHIQPRTQRRFVFILEYKKSACRDRRLCDPDSKLAKNRSTDEPDSRTGMDSGYFLLQGETDGRRPWRGSPHACSSLSPDGKKVCSTPSSGWQPFLNYLDHLKHSGEGALPVGDGMPASAVSMLTIHKSKGLEFPVVAIPGLNALQSPKPSSALDAG